MKKLSAIVLAVLMAGCVGTWTGNPYEGQYNTINVRWWKKNIKKIKNLKELRKNTLIRPAYRYRSKTKLWWKLNTAGVKKSQSPWEKFVPTVKVNRWDDPWANFQEPELFPKDWKKRFPKKVKPKKKKKKRVDKKLNRPIMLQQDKDVY